MAEQIQGDLLRGASSNLAEGPTTTASSQLLDSLFLTDSFGQFNLLGGGTAPPGQGHPPFSGGASNASLSGATHPANRMAPINPLLPSRSVGSVAMDLRLDDLTDPSRNAGVPSLLQQPSFLPWSSTSQRDVSLLPAQSSIIGQPVPPHQHQPPRFEPQSHALPLSNASVFASPFPTASQQAPQDVAVRPLSINTLPPGASPAHSCSSCDNTAVAACVECADWLCPNCVQAHQRVRLTRSHTINALPQAYGQHRSLQHASSSSSSTQSPAGYVNVTGEWSMEATQLIDFQQVSPQAPTRPDLLDTATPQCAAHPSEPALVHCLTCGHPVCRLCCLPPSGMHQQHQITFINTATQQNSGQPAPPRRPPSPELMSLSPPSAPPLPARAPPVVDGVTFSGVSTDLKHCVRALEEGLDSVGRMSERVDARVTAVANYIRAVMHHHVSALEERKRDLLTRVDVIRTSKQRALEQQRTMLKGQIEQAQEIMQIADRSQGGGGTVQRDSPTQLARQSAEIRRLIPYISTVVEDDYIAFNAPDPSAALRNLGVLMTGPHAAQCRVVGDWSRRAIRNRLAFFTVQARDHLGEVCVVASTAASPNSMDAHLVVVVQPPSRADVPDSVTSSCLADVVDRGDSTYLVSWTPTVEGEHRIHISVRGTPIQGSPYSVVVREGRDYRLIGAQPGTIFGGEGMVDGKLCRPWGICIDRQGRIIVGDRSNNRVQVFEQGGRPLFSFGTGGSRNGQFDRPAGVAVNSKNQIVVADKDNHRVQVFSADGRFEFKFGEKGKAPGQFNYPWDVATNHEDQIAVTDTRNHRIQLFDSSGAFLKRFPLDGNGGSYSVGNVQRNLDSPRGVVFAPSGHLITTDFNNHQLVTVDVVTGAMTFHGREGDWDGSFRRPQGLDVDLEGHVIVTDSRNNRLQIFTPQLNFLCSFGLERPEKHNSMGNHAEGGGGSSGLDRPCDVCITPEGRIFVVDFGNHMVKVY